MPQNLYTVLFFVFIALGTFIVIAIKSKLIRHEYSYFGMFTLALIATILMAFSSPGLKDLGIALPSGKDIIITTIATIISIFLMYLLNRFLFHRKIKQNKISTRGKIYIIFYILISAPVQEFLFRSFLHYSLEYIGILNIFTMAIFSTMLFGIAHQVFSDKLFQKATFVMGAIWGLTYYLAPNLLTISVFHGLIGLFAYSQGLMKKETLFQRII